MNSCGMRVVGVLALGVLAATGAAAQPGESGHNAAPQCLMSAKPLGAADAAQPCESQAATALDLRTPFDQPDASDLWRDGAFGRLSVRRPRGGLFDLDFSDLFNFRDVLSSSDMLLLNATSIDTNPVVTQNEFAGGERIVAGINEFGAAGSDSWTMRPEVSSYLANQAAGLSIATQSVRELRERVGVQPSESKQPSFSLWLRPVGQGDALGRDANALFQSATDTTLVHAGVDYSRPALFGEVDGMHVGLMASYGRAVSDNVVKGNFASAKGEVLAARLGVYSTWYENEVDQTGFIVDGWFAYALMRNAVTGEGLPSEVYTAGAWAGSLEAGYGWQPFDEAFRIEPQAQILYAGYGQGAHYESNGTMVDGSAASLAARLGVRMDQEWRIAGGSAVLKPFAELNWHHDFDREEVLFDEVAVGTAAPSDRYQLSVGLDATFEDNWSAALNVQAERGANDYSGIQALVSVNYAW